MALPKDDQVVVALRTAAQTFFDRRTLRDLDETLGQVVAAAVDMVPAAAGGGISRTESGTVRSSYATSDLIHELDEIQSKLEEGPCVTAADEPPASGVVVANDLAGADADRWPHFAPCAVERGFRALLSTQLATEGGRRHAALNLYSHQPDVFDDEAARTAGLFAVQAATLLYGADQVSGLGRALDTRDVIGQAKGILMERFTLTDDEAFQMLVRSSQDTNMKLVDVARWLTKDAARRRRDGASSASG